MSIATDTKVSELEQAHQQLVRQVQELTDRLTKLEDRKKPGPKPKGHMTQDEQ